MAGCGRGAERKETRIVATDSKGTVLLPGERETKRHDLTHPKKTTWGV
jgi:hypothetical protein